VRSLVSTNRFTLSERLRYAFDNTLSRGTIALIFWLAMASIAAIGFFSIIIVVTGASQPGQESLSFAEAAWASLMRTLDSGTMGGDEGWGFRIIMLCVTLVGVFILSTLIGVLGAGLEAKIDDLRKGRSRVVEEGHTVILGWSEQIFPILSELIQANESSASPAIVVLGQKDKVEMEDAIRDKVSDFKSTRIICRTGSPIELHDLAIASIDTARSIIVLAPDMPDGSKNDDPDIDVIKTLLAVTNNPQRQPGKYHLVAEVRDPRNVEVAEMVGKDEVELVLVGDLIARIMAQTCRQSGLSVVYTELLDFGGVEIYFKKQPEVVGKRFADATLQYEDSVVIGVQPKNGPPRLNPPADTLIGADERLIVIAEDDASIRVSTSVPKPELAQVQLTRGAAPKPERTLVLGWNWRGTSVINEIDSYVPKGSAMHVVASSENAQAALAADCAKLQRMTLTFEQADTTDRRVLDRVDVTSFDHVIVLCYADELEVAKADARTLITLLHLRDIGDKSNKRVPIVSEMLDINNRRLAEVTNADDFIVSDRLVSLMLAQISEQKELSAVFRELFSSAGSELYLKPIEQYVKAGASVTFATLTAAAAQAGEVAVGIKRAALAGDAAKAYGVVVAPKKSTSFTLEPGDRLIVLADN
jgi:voltage-gated potassium channel Kch